MLKRFRLIAASTAVFTALQYWPAQAQTERPGQNPSGACGWQDSGPQGNIRYLGCRYSVKFVCGVQNADPAISPPAGPPVRPGNYATTINIQNFSDDIATQILKHVVIARPENQPRGLVTRVQSVVLGPAEAVEIDRADIVHLLEEERPAPQLPSFIEGFVVLISNSHKSVKPLFTRSKRLEPQKVHRSV
jgi:hypothetical protein